MSTVWIDSSSLSQVNGFGAFASQNNGDSIDEKKSLGIEADEDAGRLESEAKDVVRKTRPLPPPPKLIILTPVARDNGWGGKDGG